MSNKWAEKYGGHYDHSESGYMRSIGAYPSTRQRTWWPDGFGPGQAYEFVDRKKMKYMLEDYPYQHKHEKTGGMMKLAFWVTVLWFLSQLIG